jgi:kumamolisin
MCCWLLVAGCGARPGPPALPDGTIDADVAGAADLGATDPGRSISVIATLAVDPTQVRAVERVRQRILDLGLDSWWNPGNSWLTIDGRAAAFARAFNVSIHDYRSASGTAFYAASPETPSTPPLLRDGIAAISPISDFRAPRRFAVTPGGMTPQNVLDAYGAAALRAAGIDGSGETVVVTIGPDGFRQAALDEFTKQYGLPPMDVELPAGDGRTLDVESIELEMDLEVIHAIAPGAKLVAWLSDGWEWPKATVMQDRAVAAYPGAIFSQSWGGCETSASQPVLSAIEETWKNAARPENGSTAFSSSGDSGAYECLSLNDDRSRPPTEDRIGVSLPASVPWMTAVGGTRISLTADGGYYHETSWEWPTLTEGTGGGYSTSYQLPDWQGAPGVPVQSGTPMRLVPDIAADAESGIAIYTTSDGWLQGGGTSQSAPMWAGFTALMNQYLKTKGLGAVGFLNPTLYALARESQPYPPFHDITQGTNLYHQATPGYDLATGLGTPDVWNLVRDIEQYRRDQGQ